ncbi:MAG: hypothetical protein ABIG56_04545 [Candidatus Omnitrophota bacterium]
MKRKQRVKIYIVYILFLFFAVGVWRLGMVSKELKMTRNELAAMHYREFLNREFLKSQSGEAAKYSQSTSAEVALREQLALLTQELATLKEDNLRLREDKEQFKQALLDSVQERKRFEARFNSLSELKKAIRKVKIKIRQEKREQVRVKKERQKEIDALELALGNRGFIIIGGRATSYRPTIKIEVKPLP